MTNWEDIRNEWVTTKITLAALAEKHDIKIGTLKSRKSREGWSRDPTKKDATKNKKVATIKGAGPKRKRSGNPNPKNQFTKRNKAAEKHGLFSKFLPEETQEIMDAMLEFSSADLIWQQIQLQYAAIIRAQKIMFVIDQEEMIKELKKTKESYSDKGSSSEEEWEFQFAWDRHATFLTAQSRAMAELRNLIKQFDEQAHIDDERRLKLEGMQVNIDKSKAELEKLTTKEEDGLIEIVIKRKGEDT
ncbi:phage terminase small subunit [Priestia filamentosa]|uniref:phage terminase small subunit n=1 Tax=Priestia filamentosa TaxID=1402861 RepID=UPI003981E034